MLSTFPTFVIIFPPAMIFFLFILLYIKSKLTLKQKQLSEFSSLLWDKREQNTWMFFPCLQFSVGMVVVYCHLLWSRFYSLEHLGQMTKEMIIGHWPFHIKIWNTCWCSDYTLNFQYSGLNCNELLNLQITFFDIHRNVVLQKNAQPKIPTTEGKSWTFLGQLK